MYGIYSAFDIPITLRILTANAFISFLILKMCDSHACKACCGSGVWVCIVSSSFLGVVFNRMVLICNECMQLGCIPRDVALYTCSSCSKQWGNGKFDSTQLKNYKKKQQKKLLCECCSAAVRCSACGDMHPPDMFAASDVKKLKKGDTTDERKAFFPS